jgi:hypothetical protein
MSIYEALSIMDFTILISRNPQQSLYGIEWLLKRKNIIDTTSLLQEPADIVNIIDLCDLVISSDATPLHVAGSLRKKGLCLFMKSANELYKKAWSRGNYWPKKLSSLYPTIHQSTLPNTSFKDMNAIIYQIVRSAAFGEDSETIELYNNLLFHLKKNKQSEELARILKSKNIKLERISKSPYEIAESHE